MQPFVCPQCGHKSSYDPWTESAHCPRCNFKPPREGMSGQYIRWAQRYGYQVYLDELLTHWSSGHTPEHDFVLETPDDAVAFFKTYQRALGEDPDLKSGSQVQYVRDYQPNRQEMLIFAGAYLRLRRGDRAGAAKDLKALTFVSPQFVEPWIWLTATTDDAQERSRYLEKATSADLGHPLARDALAIAEGKVTLSGKRRKEQVGVAQCPKCGAGLRYEPGSVQVACAHCGHQVTLQQVNIVDGPARPVRNLRLQRRYEGHAWEEAQRIVHCRTCGAELTMTQDLAHNCAFCGSTNVLVEDSGRTLEQPDGLLPFQVGKRQATEAVHQAQNAFARRLASWLTGKQYAMKELQGMYLPFWVFDGMVETYRYSKGFAQAQKESLGLSTHENLLFPGVDVPPPALLQRVYPFALQALTPYEARLLADWPAKLYSRDVELVSEQARSTMIGLAQRQRHPVVPQRQAGRHTRAPQWTEARTLAQSDTISSQVIGTTYQLVLLPLWVALLVGDDEHHLALVNGQTGKVAFDAAQATR